MNILIVDDEATALRDLSRVMRKTVPEAEIFTARDSDTALEVCKEKSIDVVFLDIQMPDMDGYEATAAIRAMKEQGHADIPILAMTANAFKEDVEASRAAGMQAHIAKPIDVNTLMNTLRSVLQ